MGYIQRIRDLLTSLGRIPLRGTLSREAGERFAIAISDQIRGARHYVDAVPELAEIPLCDLVVGMEGVVHYADTLRVYVLKAMPQATDYVGPLLQNVDNFWSLDRTLTGSTGDLMLEYAPMYRDENGVLLNEGKPPYPSDAADLPLYYANAAPYNQWDVSQATDSAWYRESTDGGSTWGPPLPLGFQGAGETRLVLRFRYFATGETVIGPANQVDGFPNSTPQDWDTLPTPGMNGGDWYMVRGQVYSDGVLADGWSSPPELLSEDPLLLGFGSRSYIDNTIDPSTDPAWVGLLGYNPSLHSFMRKRRDLGDGSYSPWIVLQLGASERYSIDTVYRVFPLSDYDALVDAPENFRPTGDFPAGWSSSPLQPEGGEFLAFSTGRRNDQGTILGMWSEPTVLGNVARVVDGVALSPGNDFKRGSGGVVSPGVITARATLYHGNQDLASTGSGIVYLWRRVREDSQWNPVQGKDQSVVSILPEDVENQDVFELTQDYAGTTYRHTFQINDISDGRGVLVDYDVSGGDTFGKDELTPKALTFALYLNGVPVVSGFSIAWEVEGMALVDWQNQTGHTLDIQGSTVTVERIYVADALSIKAVYTYDGETYASTATIKKVGVDEVLYHDVYYDPISGEPGTPPLDLNEVAPYPTAIAQGWYLFEDIGTREPYYYAVRPSGAAAFQILRLKGIDGTRGANGSFRARAFMRSQTPPTLTNGLYPIGMRGSFANPQLNKPALPGLISAGLQSSLGASDWSERDPGGAGKLYSTEADFVAQPSSGGTYSLQDQRWVLLGSWGKPLEVSTPGGDAVETNPLILALLAEKYT